MMPDPVSEREAELFWNILNDAMQEWLDKTNRDEAPADLAEKVLKRMDRELNQ